jgi:hypothetical protein
MRPILPCPIATSVFLPIQSSLHVIWKREMPPTDIPLGDQVLTALERNPYFSGRTLFFEAAEGRVTLKGVVRSYFQNQLAQEAIRHLDGVHEIFNELEVAPR